MSLLRAINAWLHRLVWPTGLRAWVTTLAIAVLLWMTSGFYHIGDGERGVITRLGRYVDTVAPGEGWRWPWPIEDLQRIDVDAARSVAAREQLLTGDQGLVDLTWSARFRIARPEDYLWQVQDPILLMRLASESAIRAQVSTMGLSALLRGGAAGVAAAARADIQRVAERWHTGLELTTLTIDEVRLPDALLSAQRDWQRTVDEQAHAAEAASAYGTATLARAQEAATRARSEAQAYAEQTVATSEGDLAGFNALVGEYEKNPAATREWLYDQTMRGILTHSRQFVIDAASAKGGNVSLPVEQLVAAIRAGGAAPVTGPDGVQAIAAPTPAPAAAGATPAPAAAQRGERLDEDSRTRDREGR